MSEDHTFELRIPSIRKNIALVEPFLRSIEAFLELDEAKYYNALIAITEAVNNAIVHGNACDESKTVTLRVQTGADELVVNIEDQGRGFDPDAVPDPRQKENILKDGGRGVFLIRSLVDDVHYVKTDDGMKLHFVVRI